MQNLDLIAKMGLADMVVPGMTYHSPLPKELERFYCYMKDGGHSVIIVLPSNPSPVEDYGIPAPVKAVLRSGYTITDRGYVCCDLPYSRLVGLICDDDDTEFGPGGVVPPGDHNDIIHIRNNGQMIDATNYWTSSLARSDKVFFSVNERCVRLLLPASEFLDDGVFAKTQYVIISRGIIRGMDAYEVLFEDGSNTPFAIHTLATQWDRLIAKTDDGRTDICFHVYHQASDGQPKLLKQWAARFRVVGHLPHLRPWARVQ